MISTGTGLNSGSSKQILNTADSSNQSLIPSGFPLHFQSHKALARGSGFSTSGNNKQESRDSSSNSNSSSSSSSKENSSDERECNEQANTSERNDIEVDGFSPTICSERLIT